MNRDAVPWARWNAMVLAIAFGVAVGAGPTDVIVSTEDEALEWMARYDSLGYRQIKLYSRVHPVVVATIVEEAKKRGMRVYSVADLYAEVGVMPRW